MAFRFLSLDSGSFSRCSSKRRTFRFYLAETKKGPGSQAHTGGIEPAVRRLFLQ